VKKIANFILQGKGGVGKSFISSLIAQYYSERRGGIESIICVDTDPNNATFSSILALDVKHLSLFDRDGKFDPRKFDTLVINMLESEEKDIVIDNGATSFLPLIEYIAENDTFAMLSDKFEIILHVPIVGGQAQKDTINGFIHLVEKWADIKFVVWINEFQGRIEDMDGNDFEHMDVYKKYKKHIFAMVYITAQNPQTFGKDIEDMMKESLTFYQVMQTPHFNLIAKQRLKMFKDSIFNYLPIILGE
jgi:hypothetical protein